VQHAVLVGREQRPEEPLRDRQSVERGQRSAPDALGQRLALQERPDDVELVVLAPHLEDGAEERAVDAAQDLGLVLEAQPGARRDRSGRDGLDDHGLAGLGVRPGEGGHALIVLERPGGPIAPGEGGQRSRRGLHP